MPLAASGLAPNGLLLPHLKTIFLKRFFFHIYPLPTSKSWELRVYSAGNFCLCPTQLPCWWSTNVQTALYCTVVLQSKVSLL